MPNEPYIATIKICAMPVQVKFTYSPNWPGTYWDPPEGPEVEIDEVLVTLRHSNGDLEGVYDITDALNDDTLDTIEEECIIYAELQSEPEDPEDEDEEDI